jgi:1-aminocyclopropane-1-carboxylate deaminase/D-cysteine desulfhydrase-like pyridoxal-dependent ACC family enzyme
MVFSAETTGIAALEAAFSDLPAISTHSCDALLSSFFDTSLNQSLTVDVLRLDRVHPFLSGNKWFKLKHHLLAASAQGVDQLVSFGGAYSNHLHALAYAGQMFGFSTVGIVRGEEPSPEKLSPTIVDCRKWGMHIIWMSRQEYRHYAPEAESGSLKVHYPNGYIIPEGGEGALGMQGVHDVFEAVFDSLDESYDLAISAVGSGTTLAGMYAARPKGMRVVGVSALKGANDLAQRVSNNLADVQSQQIEIWHDYHQGGFAKMTPLLKRFMSEVLSEVGVLLDPVYTGKAFYALIHQYAHYKLGDRPRILFVHTGGLQGWRGFKGVSPTE